MIRCYNPIAGKMLQKSMIFVFFRFQIIIIFSKEVLMICPLWPYPIVTKEQMHVLKIWDSFLVERAKKQMRCLSFSPAHS